MCRAWRHVNELPLRHVISNLDGKSVSAKKFSGPIGQQIGREDLHTSDVVAFEPIPTDVVRPQPEVLNDLSNDQRVLLEYMLGVSCGTVAAKYVNRKAWTTEPCQVVDNCHQNSNVVYQNFESN